MKLENDLILRAARGEKVERVPVWMMRQAGRILPEYREVRKRLSGFKELVETPELACEVTLQPVDILGVDAAIIFSDILVIPEAMGCIYEMIESKGPSFPNPVKTESDINALRIAEASDLQYVMDAIRLTKKALNGRIPLIGFAGAPFTLLAYMIEGGGSKTFSKAKKFLYTEPALAHQLLQKITDSTIHYLKGQIESGADMYQLFDSWAGVLSPEQYREFSLPYIQQITDAVNTVPSTVFAKGAFFAIEDFSKISCNTIGIDWNTDPEWARAQSAGKTLQGNMDPCLLYSDFETIRKETHRMIERFGHQRYIANLGHGVYPDTDKNHVKCFIDAVKEYQIK
jgi:uroporphyrinogen decarboxylase